MFKIQKKESDGNWLDLAKDNLNDIRQALAFVDQCRKDMPDSTFRVRQKVWVSVQEGDPDNKK